MSSAIDRKKLAQQILAAAIAVLVAVALYRLLLSPPNQPTAEQVLLEAQKHGTVVGTIQSVEGTVFVKPPRSSETAPAQPGPLLAEATVQTQAASAAVIEFTPGPTLRLLENSRLVTEVDSTRDGTIQATLLAGEVAVLNPGPAAAPGAKSNFVLMQDGKALDYSSGSIPRTVPLVQLDGGGGAGAKPSDALDLQEKLELERESEMATAPSSEIENLPPKAGEKTATDAAKPTTKTEAPLPNLLRSTLTNDDIRTQLRSQAGHFQKCYVTMVNRMTEGAAQATALPRGEIKVAFKIISSGKVLEPKILSTPFKDPIFDRCVLEALSRLRFRPFQGATIPIGEFPIVLE